MTTSVSLLTVLLVPYTCFTWHISLWWTIDLLVHIIYTMRVYFCHGQCSRLKYTFWLVSKLLYSLNNPPEGDRPEIQHQTRTHIQWHTLSNTKRSLTWNNTHSPALVCISCNIWQTHPEPERQLLWWWLVQSECWRTSREVLQACALQTYTRSETSNVYT